MIGIVSGRSNNSPIITGSGAPTSMTGSDGSYYIDSANPSIYGPKYNGVWPSPVPLGGTTLVSRMYSTNVYTATSAGAQTVTLPVSNPTYLELYLNGLLQPESAFTLNGAVVSINSSLNIQIGDKYEFEYEILTNNNGGSFNSGGTSTNPVPVEEIPQGNVDSNNTMFQLAYSPIVNTLNVYVNGLRINKSAYTISGTVLALNVAPDRSIDVQYYR